MNIDTKDRTSESQPEYGLDNLVGGNLSSGPTADAEG